MNIERREQVFVSSTYLDLVEERQAIIQTLMQADCLPAGMELFPASDDEKWSLITRVIDDSDYYVLVLGGRYGSVDEAGLSFTEKEFDYAASTGKPIMAFLHGQPGDIPTSKTDMDDGARQKLDAFRAKASTRMAKYWTTADGLAGQVALSLIQTRKTHPAEGWIRASSAMTPEVEREIAELRAQVATAQRDLQDAREAGARHEVDETLAQGSDVYEMPVVVQYLTQDLVDQGLSGSRHAHEGLVMHATTWDSLFGAVAPILIDEASRRSLRVKLNEFAYAEAYDDASALETVVEIVDINSDSAVLEDFEVQFFSLGLIQRSEKRHPVTDKNSYWTLTEEGRNHLMRIRAARRGTPPASA